EVIGIAPRGFYFPARDIEIYLPLGVKPELFTQMRRPHWLNVIARLKPGESLRQAVDDMKAIAARLEQTYPDTNTKMGVVLDNYHGNLSKQKRPALVMLFSAVIILFLIVCSNVANLQLGRSAARAREFKIRQALGAGRTRILRQLLTESLLLSCLGGATGLTLAVSARVMVARLAPQAIPAFADPTFDRWTVAFGVGITLIAPLLFAILPAVRAASRETVRERSEITADGGRLRTILIAVEVALAVVLAVSATLLTRSLLRLESVEPGFRADTAITFRLTFPGSRYPKDADCVRAVEQLERNLKNQPGVSVAGVSLSLPLSSFAWSGDATPEGRAGDDYEREVRHNSVTAGYFAAVGTPLLDGRPFNERDGEMSQPVTIVNEALEKKYFRGAKAVGKRIKFGRPTDSDPWTMIVGVTRDQKQDGLDVPTKPEAFQPFASQPNNQISVVVRGGATPDVLLSSAQVAVKALDSNLVLTDRQLLRDLVLKSDRDQRFRTTLLLAFALIAIFLSALGVYGVLAYSLAQRTREIGIRLALGARSREIYGLVLASGLRPVLAGAVAGIAAAFAAARLLVSLLFEVQPGDPLTYVVTILVIAITAIAACSVPAWRAIRIDPLASLREQ
ncbi:MAG: FtsX-like permease family protein, partial [Acidobacteriaceae bacterium]|nr:FtsX-like permease family protein [Acidobacteriaceae bacterium]